MQTYQQIVGTSYEYYVLEKIRPEYDDVWHWKDFPKQCMHENNLIYHHDKLCDPSADVGADIVAKKNNKYYFIQCKNFDGTILIENLAGFYFLLHENNFNGILYYNGTLSANIIKLSKNVVKFINLPFNNQTISTNQNIVIQPRDYQIDALAKLINKDKAILSLPCGMGKTYVASTLADKYDNIIILSPLRQLAAQNLEQFKMYHIGHEPILISTDGKRDLNELDKYIKPKNIISSTYDSSDVVIQLMNKLKNTFLVVDEFHNLSDSNINKSDNDLNKLLNICNNKLFLSATPLKNFMNIQNENIYTYGWDKAIENKYICDFNICIPDVKENLNILSEHLTINFNNKLMRKAYFIIKSLLLNHNKKCIIYLTTIEKAHQMHNILSGLSLLLNIELKLNQIDCFTAKTIRSKIIQEFIVSDKISILLNVHILDEGINIPECDSVFITQPSNNMINIVQRMCRANRITITKSTCNMYLWCSKKKVNKILEYLYNSTSGYVKDKIYIHNIACSTICKVESQSLQPNKNECENLPENNNTDDPVNTPTKNNCENLTENINVGNPEKHPVENNLDILPKISDQRVESCCETFDDFETFANRNNFVNSQFIKDLYGMVGGNYIERYSEFLIDSEVLRKWLEIANRQIFNDTIKRSYKKNIDYMIKTIKKSQGSGGHNLEIITLTPEASKKICLSTKSKMGPQVQQYFLDLEVALYKFKNYIIEGMNAKIKQLENNQK